MHVKIVEVSHGVNIIAVFIIIVYFITVNSIITFGIASLSLLLKLLYMLCKWRSVVC